MSLTKEQAIKALENNSEIIAKYISTNEILVISYSKKYNAIYDQYSNKIDDLDELIEEGAELYPAMSIEEYVKNFFDIDLTDKKMQKALDFVYTQIKLNNSKNLKRLVTQN